MEQLVPFDPWTPDLPGQENRIVTNVVPDAQSLLPFPSLSAIGDGLGAPAVGGYWAPDRQDNVYAFVGTATDIWQLDAGQVWQNISQSGDGFYSGVTDWEFVEYKGLIIAVSASYAPQVYTLAAYSPGTRFTPLGGSPPIAARAAVVRGHLMLGDLVSDPSSLQWSGWYEETTWDNSIRSQSGTKPILGRGGRVQKIIGGGYGLVFQENAIHRLEFIGPPQIFDIKEIARDHGTPSPESVFSNGGLVYYYSHDGFRVHDGAQSLAIGENAVDEWFLKNSAQSRLGDIRGAFDRNRRLAMWAYKSSDDAVTNDRILVYSQDNRTWSLAEIDTQLILEFRTPGESLESLESNGIITNVDDAARGLLHTDAAVFKGGALGIGAVDAQSQPALFSGAPLTAVVDTPEFGGTRFGNTILNLARPLVRGNGSVVRLRPGGRDDTRTPPVFGEWRALNNNQEVPIRENHRYHTIRLEVSQGFEHMDGVAIDIQPTGGRR